MTQDVVASQILKCPKCGFDYIRVVESSFSTLLGLKISYLCESCPGGSFVLTFHKGQTFVEEA